MTNTDNTPTTPKSNGKKATSESEPATVTTNSVATPSTTVIEKRSGISGGILAGAAGVALLAGLLIGGGTGALITRTIDLGDRPAFGQAQNQGGQQGGQQGGGQQGGGMPGQQQGGPQQGGPQGGFPGGPPQNGPQQNGPQQQGGDNSDNDSESDDSGADDSADTDN